MLNNNRERELAYLVQIESITPMNADRLECAHIGGWHCVVGKGEFKEGDPAIYFEIDSQVPDVEPFASMDFLRSKHFKIKSQKIRGEISQGLLMPVTAFGWEIKYGSFGWEPEGYAYMGDGSEPYVVDNNGAMHPLQGESRFLTKLLNVTYAAPEDNTRKAGTTDKYKRMAQRRPNIFKHRWARWFMKREWGKKLMFFLFGRKSDQRKNDWPAWVVKTDEERIQNCPWILEDTTQEWIPTEKIDGTSTTFTMYGFGRKRKFLVCSRNVVFDKPDKKCFYDTNVYTEMAEKYHMEEVMSKALNELKAKNKDIQFLTIQAETYGAGVQSRTYGLNTHDMAIFNVIIGYKNGETVRLNPYDGKAWAQGRGLPYVPVFDSLILPTDCDMVLAMAEGNSKIDGGMREGLVFRSYDGRYSFKAVSNQFLLKYHG